MHTNTSASALTKTLKAFQAVMLAMALVTLSFPVTATPVRAQEATDTPTEITSPTCEGGQVLNDEGTECVDPAPEPLNCEDGQVPNDNGTECVDSSPEDTGPQGNGPQSFSLKKDDDEEHKIDICHYEGNHAQVLNIDEHAWEGEHGHQQHLHDFKIDGEHPESGCIDLPAPENSCALPDTLDADGTADVNEHSPDGSHAELQEILDGESYGVDVDTDQTGTQQWNDSGNTVHFSAKFIAKFAGDKHVFGYKADGGAFVPVFKDYATFGGDPYPAVPQNGTQAFDVVGANAVVFAMEDITSGKTYVTKTADNFDGKQHVVVYNPEDNTYALGFEDQTGATLGDHDYNDLVVELKVTGCEKPDNDTVTIVATKIVCDNESDIPNNMGSSHVTDEETATDWINGNEEKEISAHPSCHLEKDWQFEWGDQNSADGGRDLVGHASGYTTSGMTAADGTVSMTVPLDDVSEIHVRELLQDGYIPFTYDTAHPSDDDNVSAVISCDVDGLHYDNYDFIRNPEKGSTYYCVAWNVEKEHAPTCDPKINLVANGSFEAPDVTNGAGWDIFDVGTSPSLVWLADFLGAAPGGEVELHGGVNGWLASDGVQYTELDSDINGPSAPGGQSAVEISQNLTTVPGQKYHVSFDFSARPGTDATQNSVGVYADGNPVGIVNALSATAGNQTEWSSHGFDFTAGDASTLLALRDAGIPNDSLGTFIDNVKVTCVPDETPADVCSNIEGDQEVTPDGYVNNDGICTPEVQECNEDATHTYLSSNQGDGGLITLAVGSGAAKLVGSPNGAWFVPGLGDGLWIWKDTFTSDTDAQNPTSQTFERDFQISGTPLDATLTLAADNTYDVVVNGNEICSDLGEFNYGATVDCTIPAADMTTGWNTMDITVTNKPIENSNGSDNPAGLSFKLVTHDNQCVPETPTDVCSNLEGNQEVTPEGYNNSDGICTPVDDSTPTDETPTHRNRHNGSGGGNTGEVLGASTCGPLLTDYLKLGWNNNPDQVKALQQFLNDQIGVALPVSGLFGPATFEAVKAFQMQYGNDVLHPWVGLPASGITGNDTPTGFVYQTTRWKINNLFCPGSEQFPAQLN